jgi:hypothetical protein
VSSTRKYSTVPMKSSLPFFPPNLSHEVISLLNASAAGSTWKKHHAAVNCFRKFEFHKGVKYAWPMPHEVLCDFVVWCVSVRKLKVSTVQSYLSSFGFVFQLNGWDPAVCNSFIIKQMLRGASNLTFYNDLAKSARKVMTLPLLKILMHQIAISELCKLDKQVIWTACTVAFFGSFRFGELLASKENIYVPHETLLWGDISFKTDAVAIRIKIPKSRNVQGEIVDLFFVQEARLCPVRALMKLRSIKSNIEMSKPVFVLSNGKFLTISKINQLLSDFLVPVVGALGSQITGHSFRAALPSSLANCPEIASDEDIRRWGRWNSSSYRLYTRLKPRQKRMIFDKIMLSLKYMKV